MKTSGTTDEILPLTKKQKYACNIVMGVMLVVAGLILVLAGSDVIHVAVGKIAAPTVLFGLGSAILFSAIIAKNSLSMWIAGVIISCGMPALFVATTNAGYAQLYPIYVAAPGIGCVFAIWFAEAKLPQIKTMLFFGAAAGILSLGSSGLCGMGITCGVLAAFIGVCVIVHAVTVYRRRDKEDA